MLITTGRNPDSASRAIARALHLAVPESRLEGRGRRTLSSLLSRARKLHFSRICTIYKAEGKPCSISFISLGADGGWAWLSPRIIVTKVTAAVAQGNRLRNLPQSGCIAISGPKSGILRGLFGLETQDCGPESRIIAAASKITVASGGTKLLELGVRYEK